MSKSTLKDRLTNFLLTNCVLAEFSENVQNFHGVSFDEFMKSFQQELDSKSPEYAWIGEWAVIMEAFEWKVTQQGADFWDRLHLDWQKLCGNN